MFGVIFTVRVPVPPSGLVTVSVVLTVLPPVIATAVRGTERVPSLFSTTVPTVSKELAEVTVTPVSNAPPAVSVNVAFAPEAIDALGEADMVPGPAVTFRPCPVTAVLVPVPPLVFVAVTAYVVPEVNTGVAEETLTDATIATGVTDFTVAEIPEAAGKLRVAPGKKPVPLKTTVTPLAPWPTPLVVPL